MKFFCLNDIHSEKDVTETKKRSKNTIEATFAVILTCKGRRLIEVKHVQ